MFMLLDSILCKISTTKVLTRFAVTYQILPVSKPPTGIVTDPPVLSIPENFVRGGTVATLSSIGNNLAVQVCSLISVSIETGS